MRTSSYSHAEPRPKLKCFKAYLVTILKILLVCKLWCQLGVCTHVTETKIIISSNSVTYVSKYVDS